MMGREAMAELTFKMATRSVGSVVIVKNANKKLPEGSMGVLIRCWKDYRLQWGWHQTVEDAVTLFLADGNWYRTRLANIELLEVGPAEKEQADDLIIAYVSAGSPRG
jgi:hypothetical protein